MLDDMLDELWPKVCDALKVDPDSIEKPKIRRSSETEIYLAGGNSDIMYWPGDNVILVVGDIDQGQLVHEIGEAVQFLSPDMENFSEDIAKMIEEEVR